jgi:hypothetical protein
MAGPANANAEGKPSKDEDGGTNNHPSDGAGPEGTIPETEDGIAASSTDEASNFEPEEDTSAAEDNGS